MESLHDSLIELCTNKLPESKVAQCIKPYMNQDPSALLPYSLVKHCLTAHQQQDGVIFKNGFVTLQKDYFWGKVNKSIFGIE